MMKCFRLVNLGLLNHYRNEESLSDEAWVKLEGLSTFVDLPALCTPCHKLLLQQGFPDC